MILGATFVREKNKECENVLEDVFNIDSVESYLDTGFKWFGLDLSKDLMELINFLINMFFGLLKLLVYSLNFMIRQLFNLDILSSKLDEVFKTGSQIFDKFYSTFAVVFFAFILMFVVKDFMKQGLQKVFTRLAMFAVLVLISLGFFSSGAKFLKQINTITLNAQEQIVGVMTPKNSEMTEKLLKKYGDGRTPTATETVQNNIYYSFVLQNFALLNFGKSDIPMKNYENYLIRKGEDVNKRNEEIRELVKKENNNNSYFTVKKIQDKFAIILNAFINFAFMGSILLVIAVLNFLIQILILGLILIFPVFSMIALFPEREYVLFNAFKIFGLMFGGKVALGAGFGLIFTIFGWIDGVFGQVTTMTVFASLFVKVVLFFLIKWNWSSLKRLVTEGRWTGGMPSSDFRGLGEKAGANWGAYKNWRAGLRNETNFSDYEDEIEDNNQHYSSKTPPPPTQDLSQDYRDNVILQSAYDFDDDSNLREGYSTLDTLETVEKDGVFTHVKNGEQKEIDEYSGTYIPEEYQLEGGLIKDYDGNQFEQRNDEVILLNESVEFDGRDNEDVTKKENDLDEKNEIKIDIIDESDVKEEIEDNDLENESDEFYEELGNLREG